MKDNSFSIHERNIQSLAMEILKFLDGMSPSFRGNVSRKNISSSYDLRNHKELSFRNPKRIRYGTETVSCIVPKIWSKVPKTIKMSSSLESINQKYQNGNHNATAAFAQNICTMLVSLMLFSFYLLWFR